VQGARCRRSSRAEHSSPLAAAAAATTGSPASVQLSQITHRGEAVIGRWSGRYTACIYCWVVQMQQQTDARYQILPNIGRWKRHTSSLLCTIKLRE